MFVCVGGGGGDGGGAGVRKQYLKCQAYIIKSQAGFLSSRVPTMGVIIGER